MNGSRLLFASRAEIEAAPAAEREAYLRIVDGLVTNPSAFDMERDTGDLRSVDPAWFDDWVHG